MAVAKAWNELMPVLSARLPKSVAPPNSKRVAYLHKTKLDAVEDARAAQQGNQAENAPKDTVDLTDEMIKKVHDDFGSESLIL